MALSSRHVLLVCVLCVGHTMGHPGLRMEVSQSPDSSLFHELLKRISAEQATQDIPQTKSNRFRRIKGMYDTKVMLSVQGTPELAMIRSTLQVEDNNMFSAAWVTTSLLEAMRYGKAPRPSEAQITLTVDSLRSFYDRNVPEKSSVTYFWPMEYNDSVSYYQAMPVNLMNYYDQFDIGDALRNVLKKLGAKSIASLLSDFDELKHIYDVRVLHVPADFDCTFVNIGLGSLLYQSRGDFPNAWHHWISGNNISSAFESLKEHAYRPFSEDSDVNSIDPRTYFWMRDFLHQAKEQGRDVALVPTWVQHQEDLRKEFPKGVSMLFQVNNVDATVLANAVYGITASVLSGMVSPTVLDDLDLQKIYHNSSTLLAYVINNKEMSDPAIVNMYYPSLLESYWFTSRTFDILNTARKHRRLPKRVLEKVYQTLKSALRGEMTRSILSKVQHDGKGLAFFDDFIGDGDVTFHNKSLVRAEDRIFTTAMAVNALLFTWTTFDESSGTVHWSHGTSATVKQTIADSVAWLTKNVLNKEYKASSPFFNAMKGPQILPYWYPANRFEFLNGTAVDNRRTLPQETFVYAVQGLMDPKNYDKLLTGDHFGHQTPLTFPDYKSPSWVFPLWSCDAYTYSTTLLALARYNNIRH